MTAGLVIAADQLTKSLALHYLSSGPVHVVGPLDLQLSLNSGVAFSLGRGFGPVLVAIGAVLVGLLALFARRAPTVGVSVAVGLVLGGALGNLVDRVARGDHGSVVDFVAFHFWPTFNLADSCITIGAILLVVLLARRA